MPRMIEIDDLEQAEAIEQKAGKRRLHERWEPALQLMATGQMKPGANVTSVQHSGAANLTHDAVKGSGLAKALQVFTRKPGAVNLGSSGVQQIGQGDPWGSRHRLDHGHWRSVLPQLRADPTPNRSHFWSEESPS